MLENKEIENKYKAKIIISWLIVIAWAGVIFYLSSRTAPESTVQSQSVISLFAKIFGAIIKDNDTMSRIDGVVRETAHGVEYLILGMVFYNALFVCLNYTRAEEAFLSAQSGIECTDKYRMLNCIICSILICTLYAFSDEIHQIAVPGRTFQLIDLVIDFIGSSIGTLVMALFYKNK